MGAMSDKITKEEFLEAVREAAAEDMGEKPLFTAEEHTNIKAMREFDSTFSLLTELSMRTMSDLRLRARAILTERRKKGEE